MRGLLTSFAKNRVFANIFLAIVILSGSFAGMRLVRETFPEFTLDMITVSVPWPGADPEEVEEAGLMDGCSRLGVLWRITLPLLMPLILSMTIFISIARVLSFEIVYALTQGGPGMSTALMSYTVYLQAFRVLNFGYASAVAMGLFFIVLVVGIVGFGFVRRAWARTRDDLDQRRDRRGLCRAP